MQVMRHGLEPSYLLKKPRFSHTGNAHFARVQSRAVRIELQDH